ncbi:EPIDERMAL PATTERNING FACTOR-like protein 6 [Cannabis sativa]|uniref:EPIDERMAL PATTERNING FACTOR-like protein 6 n=1 Tax=Cannabis sativa TaxID=3483 RepID=UPI0029CAA985|nr:EPIDERMAL PATTERNING FACTOR-like protein 6 [Cannabis sativa]
MMMKGISIVHQLKINTAYFLVIFLVITTTFGLRPHQYMSVTVRSRNEGGEVGMRNNDPNLFSKKKDEVVGLGMEMYPTGSSLPDCSHACGPCFPCKRVMVSFKCSVESCPIVYRCMCKGKYYHVPSN